MNPITIPRALEALEARANPWAGAEPQTLSTAAMRAAEPKHLNWWKAAAPAKRHVDFSRYY
jgi:hypothetical protein